MVTRSVILVTPSEAAAFAATSTLSSSAAAADSVISNAPFEQNSTEELQTNSCNYPSYTKPAQHPSPCGLVQLCRHKECFHAVDFEKRGGGLCCIHQKGPMYGEQNDSEDDGKICGVTADDGLCDRFSDRHSTHHDNNCGLDEVGKKRDCPSGDSISNNKTKKFKKVDAFVIDLSDVPPQPPIPKCAGYIKEGASKYRGVCFNKQMNKWRAQIMIDGKYRHIGYYENEEEAAVDYARAVFMYKGQGAFDKTRERRALDNAREKDSFIIDLSDVPPQSPVPKSAGHIKEGASKYKGVSFDKKTSKWHAQIMIAGKSRHIGYYENEEEAAVDYARAVFKYKGQGHWDRSHDQLGGAAIGGNKTKKRQKDDAFAIDLTDVPSQSPISKCAGTIKGASKYAGVTFDKQTNKWRAQISIEGKQRFIGSYDNEKKAAAYYARAVFKYKGRGALDKARERCALDKEREQNGEVCGVTTADEGLCDRHLTHGNKYGLDNEVGKRDRTSGGSIGGNKTKKCKKVDAFRFDLTGVPPQPSIPKSAGGYIKEGASTYKGLSFCKQTNKWHAQIYIDAKNRHIGSYENEEEAAVDYARAAFKYKGQRRGALEERLAQDTSSVRNYFIIDLRDVPPQSPIPKSAGHIRDGASRYTGVTFNKQKNKWQAQISIDGKQRSIGYYEYEEEAAVDYARAVFKYRGQGALDKAREQDSIIIDLTGVPPQSPIPKSAGYIKEGASKYTGVHFNKLMNKWQAQIKIDGKKRSIGSYVNEEEAAADYARAVFKFNGQGALDKARERRARDLPG